MNAEQTTRPVRTRTMWMGVATMAAVTILAAVARRSAGADAAVVVATIYSVGVVLTSWLTSLTTPYPRWAWFTAAGINVLALVIAAAAFPSPSQVKTWMSTAWMFPWLFLVFSATPRYAAPACDPATPMGGRLLIVVSVVYAAILLGSLLLTN